MRSRLKELRQALELNQTAFGAKIGVGQSSISSYERTLRQIPEPVMIAICHRYNVNEYWLAFGVGQMFNS